MASKSSIAVDAQPAPLGWRALYCKEDWWAIWLGLGLILLAIALFPGNSAVLKQLAISPGGLKWTSLDQVFAHFGAKWDQYLLQFAVFAVLFGATARLIGFPLKHFLPGFTLLYLLSLIMFAASGWVNAGRYNLEPPLLGLLAGLVLANFMRLPAWMDAAFRVEYFVKLGIVLLGATFPIGLVLTAGPVAIGQATIISILTAGVIYLAGTRLFSIDKRLAAVLSTGGAVCGVSASMAISAAVGAKKEHLYTSVTLVVLWALIMVVALPFLSQWLGLSAGVAGAWIGTSEFADAAGFAAASTYGKMAGNEEVSIKAFTLMKVIGRDLWIGIWSLFWALLATLKWDSKETGVRPNVSEIWRRLPKFVIGFFLASIGMTAFTAGMSAADMAGTVKVDILQPLFALRGWAFLFSFLSIGLTTRFRDLKSVDWRPATAFSMGVVVNVVAGYVLSVLVFGEYWGRL